VFGLQKLLWEIRKDPSLAQRYAQSGDEVLDLYEIGAEERAAFKENDFKYLYENGANPYLLYFCALQLGFDRAEYYSTIRGTDKRRPAEGNSNG
jgi:hypothetical protein